MQVLKLHLIILFAYNCSFFSLKNKAKAWLNSLSPGSITSWELLVTKFLSKIFLMAKTNALRRVCDFHQDDEAYKFLESYERFLRT